MKDIKLPFVGLFIAFALLLASESEATPEMLAKFLEIDEWKTVVDLPAESYVVEIFEITNGALGKRVNWSTPEADIRPESGIVILAGPHEGNFKMSINFLSRNVSFAATVAMDRADLRVKN